MSLESYEEKYVEDMKLDELTKLVDGATAAQSKTSNNAAFIKPVDTENLKEVCELSTLYICIFLSLKIPLSQPIEFTLSNKAYTGPGQLS